MEDFSSSQNISSSILQKKRKQDDMSKRFLSIWFPYLGTDWHRIRKPELRKHPVVLAEPSHGKMIVASSDQLARRQGIHNGMAVADARAIIPNIQVIDHQPELHQKLLGHIAEWCIRFTPFVAIDGSDGLVLDVTGCTYLWGSDENYLAEIEKRFLKKGYNIRLAMADTAGAAWAVSRFGKEQIIEKGKSSEALQSLPPEGLRLDTETVMRLHKLGLSTIGHFMSMQKTALRRRFGPTIITRLGQALGTEEELIEPVCPVEPYLERLTCLDPITTATGIEIALKTSLASLCKKLRSAEKGLRSALFKCYRVDGRIEIVEISTSHPTHNEKHILKLFESKLSSIEPAEGIEVFELIAPLVEEYSPCQEKLWEIEGGADQDLSELIDRFSSRMGAACIKKYVPDEHFWPERSFKPASSVFEKPGFPWLTAIPRPLRILPYPEAIEVTAPIPDYPPMLFRRKNKLHIIKKADGPERIEQEWWIQDGQHRDYYAVEDEEGKRYWLFRLGHYGTASCKWFLHGFFA